MSKTHYDCSGYATKADMRCSDGRTIRKNAFEECDGKRVPLVWNHEHNNPDAVLGHAILENRPDGVYAYLSFNDTDAGGLYVNLNDYNVGADKGGEVTMFDDFDIDFNAMKYLMETRASGAMIKPYAAVKKNEKIEIVDFEKEAKRRERKEKFQNKVDSAMNWIHNNKEIVMLVGPTLISGVAFGAKTITKQVRLNKEKNLKDLYCYDRSLGHYWKLRRELTNSEWVEIDQRKQNGERLADILDELKALK